MRTSEKRIGVRASEKGIGVQTSEKGTVLAGGMRADARSEASGLQGEAYQDSASSRFLGESALPPSHTLSLASLLLAIFKNHTQAEINPSNVITDLLKPGVERHLAVPSPGSVKRALRFSRVL